MNRGVSIAVLAGLLFYAGPASSQEILRALLQRRLNTIDQGAAADAQSNMAKVLPTLAGKGFEKCEIAGLDTAVWRPRKATGRYPLIVFSHGFHGCNTQSLFIMQALADAGYMVLAPNHEDALGKGNSLGKPDANFRDVAAWSERTFKNRGEDITKLLDALHKDSGWNHQIDWAQVVLMGHSLGGYTVLALAGAWPGWKLPGIKAIVALSPYCVPFLRSGNLSALEIPVMYQGGTRDFGITPFIKGPHGAFNKTSSPAYFVEFDQAGHFSWTNFNKDQKQESLITLYIVSFLNKYVKGDTKAKPEAIYSGVTELDAK